MPYIFDISIDSSSLNTFSSSFLHLLGMLLDTLGACLLGNLLKSKGTISEGEGKIRAGEGRCSSELVQLVKLQLVKILKGGLLVIVIECMVFCHHS